MKEFLGHFIAGVMVMVVVIERRGRRGGGGGIKLGFLFQSLDARCHLGEHVSV